MVDFFDDEFPINTVNVAGPDFSDHPMTVLPDGRIVVVWNAGGPGGDGDSSGFGQGIKARFLNPDGSPAGPEFLVNTTLPQIQEDASVALLADGRFVVTWRSFDGLGDGDPDVRASCIRARVFNADGTPSDYNGSTNDFVVNTVAGGQQYSPVVTALNDGGFVVAFASEQPAFVNNIVIRQFTSTGPVGPDQFVYTTNNPYAPTLLTLGDGRFVLAWHQDFGTDGNLMRFYLANGAPDPAINGGNPISIETTIHDVSHDAANNPHLALLTDGRIVATWTHYDDGHGNPDGDPNASVRARVFLANGTPDPNVNGGVDFRVNISTSINQHIPHAVALPGGGFFITYSSSSAVAGQNGVLGREFSATGVGHPAELLVQDDLEIGFTGTLSNAVVSLSDGRVLALSKGASAALEGRFIEDATASVVLNGDGAANELLGTRLADTLRGNDGADFLMGGGGSDILEGGAGGDRLHGGGGNDNLKGGGGLDLLNGGLGVDTADYGDQTVPVQVFLNDALDGFAAFNNILEDVLRAIEYVIGGSGNDALVGDGGINALYGRGGRDFLFANGFAPDGTMKPNANTDSLFGEEGDDGLFGGDGNDTLWGGDGSDGLVGGGGDDYMNGGASADFLFGGDFNPDGSFKPNSGNDLMYGDGGNDAIYGFDGNDVITGGADNDYLDGGHGNDTVEGDAGNDFVLGGDGGDDTISGGAGFDYLYGGPSGNDTFVFRKGDSADWALDFGGGDKIRLEGFGFANFAAIPLVDVSTEEAGPAVQLTVFNAANSTYDQLTVFGVGLAGLNAGNVILAA